MIVQNIAELLDVFGLPGLNGNLGIGIYDIKLITTKDTLSKYVGIISRSSLSVWCRFSVVPSGQAFVDIIV